MLSKIFTSKITLILSFLLLAAGLVAGVTLIRYPQILFPEAAQCPGTTGPFSLYCVWDAPAGAVSYDYAITKNPANPEVVQAESGISETFVEFPAYPNEQYTCLVSAYNHCGTKSQKVSSVFSCTAPTPTPKPGCENCVGGTEKKYPEDVWDISIDDGIINDCQEACLAFYGPACIQGACAVPGSTNPANCCGCQTADGVSCATLPTPTPPPTVDCRPHNCRDNDHPTWLDKTFYFKPNIPGVFSDSNCTQEIADLTSYCTAAETGTISGTVTVNNPHNRPVDFTDVEQCKIREDGSRYDCGVAVRLPVSGGGYSFNSIDGQKHSVNAGAHLTDTGESYPWIVTVDQVVIVPESEVNFTITIPAGGTGTGVQGDISGAEGEPDGTVDAADASVLMTNWGVPFGFNPAADLNNDGRVDALDASLLIQGWGKK